MAQPLNIVKRVMSRSEKAKVKITLVAIETPALVSTVFILMGSTLPVLIVESMSLNVVAYRS